MTNKDVFINDLQYGGVFTHDVSRKRKGIITYDAQVQLWSLLTHCLETVVTDHGHPVTAVSLASLSRGQVLVLSGSWRQEVRIYSQQDKSNLPSVRLPR